MPSDMYPALPSLAPIVRSFGGPVIASPKVVPLFFSNDDPALAAELKTFHGQLGSSAYWSATTAEYGVGAMTSAPIDLAESATGQRADTDIQAWHRFPRARAFGNNASS